MDQKEPVRGRLPHGPETGKHVIVLMGEPVDRQSHQFPQAPGHPQPHQEGGHIGFFPGTGFGADPDGFHLHPGQVQGFQQVRQIPGMLEHHLRLGQSPVPGLHAEQPALIPQEMAVKVHQGRRSGIAAGIQSQDRFFSGHVSSPGSPEDR